MKVTSTLEVLKVKTVTNELQLALKAVRRAHRLSMGTNPPNITQANRLAELTHTIWNELSNYYHEG